MAAVVQKVYNSIWMSFTSCLSPVEIRGIHDLISANPTIGQDLLSQHPVFPEAVLRSDQND